MSIPYAKSTMLFYRGTAYIFVNNNLGFVYPGWHSCTLSFPCRVLFISEIKDENPVFNPLTQLCLCLSRLHCSVIGISLLHMQTHFDSYEADKLLKNIAVKGDITQMNN